MRTSASASWMGRNSGSVYRFGSVALAVSHLASDVEGPYGTSYAPETGYVLWTSAGDETVQMAPANGASGSTVTLNSSFEEYFAIENPRSSAIVSTHGAG